MKKHRRSTASKEEPPIQKPPRKRKRTDLPHDETPGPGVSSGGRSRSPGEDHALIADARRDIKEHRYNFKGSLSEKKKAPEALCSVVAALLVRDTTSRGKIVNSIADTILLNSRDGNLVRRTATRRKSPLKETRSMIDRSLWLYAHFKSKGMVVFLQHHGLTVTYSRMRSIIDMIVHQKIEDVKALGLYRPSHFRKGVVIVNAVDNVDQSARNTTGGCFHGTSISLFQNGTGGEAQDLMPLKDVPEGFSFQMPEIFKLPEESVYIPPLHEIFYKGSDNINASALNPEKDVLQSLEQEMDDWLQFCAKEINAESRTQHNVSCFPYFAEKCPTLSYPQSITRHEILPVMFEEAHTAMMTKHSLNLMLRAVHHLNPGQKVIDVRDCPLYALAKSLQLHDDAYGVEHIFLMMGPLHVEQVSLKMHGELIDGTGVEKILNIANPRPDNPGAALVSGGFITRARYLLQVLLVSLFCLQHEAFEKAAEEDKSQWIAEQARTNDNFFFWTFVMKLEKLILSNVKSIRTNSLKEYRSSLAALCPFFFAMDHYHYARWVPVSLYDLAELEANDKTTYDQVERNFTVKKTNSAYSSMGIDQAHEQANCKIKDVKGGLAFMNRSKEESMLKWALSCPELLRIIEECEVSDDKEKKHHESSPSFQSNFVSDCRKVTSAIRDVFNPFDSSAPKDLCYMNNGQPLLNGTFVNTDLRQMHTEGQQQYQQFVTERLVGRTLSIGETIPKNSFLVPSRASSFSVKERKISEAKEVKLIRRLRCAAPYRPELVKEALRFEVDDEPRVFMLNNQQHRSAKSSLLKRLKTVSRCSKPSVEVAIFDLSSVTHCLASKSKGKTFSHLSEVLYTYVKEITASHSSKVSYVVSDRYDVANVLKNSPSTGSQITVALDAPIPNNFQSDFLRNAHNKDSLYSLLAPQIYRLSVLDGNTNFAITDKEETLGIDMPSCNHLEADYRMVLFVLRAIENGHKSVIVRTGDTDVVVIMVGHYERFSERCPDFKLYVMLQTSSDITYYDVGKLASDIGISYGIGFMLLYAYTGCDYTPSFSYHGKTAWYDVYKSDDGIKELFKDLCSNPDGLDIEKLHSMINLTLRIYGVSSPSEGLINGRFEVLQRPNTTTFRSLPPSPGAAMVQARKALLVAGHLWAKAHQPIINLPDMSNWGWTVENGEWLPIWTVNLRPYPTVFEDCYKTCSKNCKCRSCDCRKKRIKCLPDCGCSGNCVQLKDNSVNKKFIE